MRLHSKENRREREGDSEIQTKQAIRNSGIGIRERHRQNTISGFPEKRKGSLRSKEPLGEATTRLTKELGIKKRMITNEDKRANQTC